MVPASRRFSLAVLAGLSLTMGLAACDIAGNEVAPPGAVSEGEAAALDEAAKMLDEQRIPQGALPDVDPPVVQGAAGVQDGADTAGPQ